MKWNDVYVAGTAAWLCTKENVQDAVRDGRYDAEECETDDLLSISVAGPDEFPPDMAVGAAREALRRSGAAAENIQLVAHASVGYQGLDLFTPASYIQGQALGGGTAAALNVSQASNGGMAALELAASYLAVRGDDAAALVTTGDKFAPPLYDRYRTDSGIVLADGATGLVLSRGTGVARLLSTSLISDPTHEGFWRGDTPWSDYSDPKQWPVDLEPRKQRYLDSGGELMSVMMSLDERQQEALDMALADAGTTVDQVAWFVYPHVGRKLFDWDLLKSLGILEERTTWGWGRQVGHLGGGDQAAGLNHLFESGAVGEGDRVVLVGTGGGWSFGCAVLEVLRTPEWSGTAGR